MSPEPKHVPPRVIAYCRVSTREQGDSGLGIAAQRAAVEAECAHRDWLLVDVIVEVGSGKGGLEKRPGLVDAMQRMDAGEADILLSAKLDRLSRDIRDSLEIMRRAERKRWSIRVLNFDLDTTTPEGEVMAMQMLTFAQYERRVIGRRTQEALQAKRRAGAILGGPQVLDDSIVSRIVAARAAGQSLGAIADDLAADGVSTARGGAVWHRSTIKAILESQAGVRLAG